MDTNTLGEIMDDLSYNNGKVKIGSSYYMNPLKPRYIENDRDMLKLQQCLIKDPELRQMQYNIRATIATILFVVVAIILLRIR
jgi:hypothetical protein